MEENTNTTGGRSMTPLLLGGIVLLLVLLGVGYVASQQNNNQEPTQQVTEDITQPTQTANEPTTNPAAGGIEETKLKEFSVTGSNFKFDPAEIRVKVGDTVKITFTATGMMHDFVIDELNAKTKILQPGQTETIEFVASEAGTFEYYCSVGQHRQNGMVGNLIVE